MKRRDTFRLIPLTLASIGGLVHQAKAFEKDNCTGFREGKIPLAFQYTNKVREMLTWIRKNQSEKLLESAYAITRKVLKGRTCWCYWNQGHSYSSDIFPGRNGEPEILTPGYDPKKTKDGDLFLVSSLCRPPIYNDLDKKDIFVIGSTEVWSGDAKEQDNIRKDVQQIRTRPYSDIWIETNLTTTGAVVKVPGMPASIGPVSGPLGMTMLWMMLGDACRILSIEGKSVKVKGDEPELSGGNINWVGLADPLMDDYFDEVLRQIELIGAELGNVRKIAKMAVDTLLNGGNLYFYSRYRESFAAEAAGRRGGFPFSIASYDGHIEGTSKDCVIMGTYKPDDEADLKNLDEFKRRGMRVASVGPITRDYRIPEGRTVHRETEAHIGRMCDTYGLYAIPGFDKKVCPTSGILNCTMLWCITMEIVEQIMDRTGGNLPAVYFSGAIKWSGEHNPRMQSMSRDRGY